MKKLKTIFRMVFEFVLVFVFIQSTTAINIEHSAIVEHGQAYLKVTIRGFWPELELVLSDAEGNTIDKAYIFPEDLYGDRIESKKLRMAEYGKTPKAGTYTLTIFPLMDIHKITFKGAKLNITNAKFNIKYSAGKGKVTKVILKVNNDGDLPAIIDKISIRIDDKVEIIPILFESICQKEEKELELQPLTFYNLREGNHSCEIQIYSDEDLLASYWSEVVCKAPYKPTPTPVKRTVETPMQTPTPFISTPTPTTREYDWLMLVGILVVTCLIRRKN